MSSPRDGELGPTQVQVEAGRRSELPTLRIVGQLDAYSAHLLRDADDVAGAIEALADGDGGDG